MGTRRDGSNLSQSGKAAGESGEKAHDKSLTRDHADCFDADGKPRNIKRVNFYTFDAEGYQQLCGSISEIEGRLVATPADDPALQEILAKPLELPGESIPPSQTERFLKNLELVYTSRDFAASRMFEQYPTNEDEDGGIRLSDTPAAEDMEVWRRHMDKRLEWLMSREKVFSFPVNANDNGEVDPDLPLPEELDDSGCITEAYFKRVLPPIPDWMRKPPRRRKGPNLFDDE